MVASAGLTAANRASERPPGHPRSARRQHPRPRWALGVVVKGLLHLLFTGLACSSSPSSWARGRTLVDADPVLVL
jgi:hypothetical protein